MAQKKSYSPKISISDEQRELLGKRLLEEVKLGMQGKATLDANVATWNNQYEGVLPPKSDPWEHCANLHIGITQWQVDTTVSNLANVIFGSDPVIGVNPRETGDVETGKELKLRHTYLQERIGLRGGPGREITQATVKHGTGIAKLTWDTWEEILSSVKTNARGEEDVVENIIRRHGPALHYVPIRDFVMCPADATSMADATIVGDRRRLRLSEIRKREGMGFYLPGTAEEVKNSGVEQPKENTETQDTIGITQQSEVGTFSTYHDAWELIAELPVKQGTKGLSYDPEGTKVRLCLVTLIGERPVLARLVIYPWFHGRKHYIPFRIKPREGQFWGIGVCQMLASLNDEIDTEHNQRTDERSLRLKRPIVRVRGAQITQDGKSRLVFAPGAVLDVNEKDDLTFLDVSNPSPESAAEEEMLRTYAERVTGVTEQRAGMVEPGAKTLGEVNAAEMQGNVRFDDMVSCFQGYGDFHEGSGLRELAYQLIGLDWQFSTPEEKARVSGSQGGVETQKLPDLTLDDVIGAYDYIPQGNSMQSNVANRRNDAVLLRRELIESPIVAPFPERVWNLEKRTLDAFGVKDWQGVIGTEEETVQKIQQMQQQQMQQQQAEMMAKGGLTQPPGQVDQGGDGGGEAAPITPEEVDAEMQRMMQEEQGAPVAP